MMEPKILAINGIWYSQSELIQQANIVACSKVAQYQKDIWCFILRWFDKSDTIELKTSGSTGVPKRIVVSKVKMQNSARRTLRFFKLQPASTALLALSAEYIAGQMMIVRAIEGNLNLITVEPTSAPLDQLNECVDFATLVPMQLTKYSGNIEKLNLIGKLILGGTAVNDSVVVILQESSVEAYESYGMTETLSHIALRRLNGCEKSSSFQPLEGVTIGLDSRGALTIFDSQTLDEAIQTNDMAEIFHDGTFKISGRVDNVINSGGVKISPEEIERSLAPYIQHSFAISSVKDDRLGQKMVLVTELPISELELETLNTHLERFKRISKLVVVDKIPFLNSGKLDRLTLLDMVKDLG